MPNFQPVYSERRGSYEFRTLETIHEVQGGVTQKIGCFGKYWAVAKTIMSCNSWSERCHISSIGHISELIRSLCTENIFTISPRVKLVPTIGFGIFPDGKSDVTPARSATYHELRGIYSLKFPLSLNSLLPGYASCGGGTPTRRWAASDHLPRSIFSVRRAQPWVDGIQACRLTVIL